MALIANRSYILQRIWKVYVIVFNYWLTLFLVKAIS